MSGTAGTRARPAGIAALLALALVGSGTAAPVVAYADPDPTPLWEAYPLEGGSRAQPLPGPRPSPPADGRAGLSSGPSPATDSSGGPGVVVLLGLLLLLGLGLRVMPRRPPASTGAPAAREPAGIDSLWTTSA